LKKRLGDEVVSLVHWKVHDKLESFVCLKRILLSTLPV